MSMAQQARIRRTDWLFEDPQSFKLQLVHEIKHGDEIKTCPNCCRILYVPEIEESPAESPRPAEPTKA